MNNQDALTPSQYAKMVGMFPDAPHNPLPTGGYMDEGFDWVVHQAESFEEYECSWCGKDIKKGGKFYFVDGAWQTDALCVSCKEEGDDEEYEWEQLNIRDGTWDAESFEAENCQVCNCVLTGKNSGSMNTYCDDCYVKLGAESHDFSQKSAESFAAESCNMCGGKTIYDKRFNEEWGDELAVCEECFNDAYGAESFGAENERICDYCEKEAKDMGMVTFPNGLAVCDICFDEQISEMDAESFGAESPIVAFRYKDDSPAHVCSGQGYTNTTRCGQSVNWDRIHYPYHLNESKIVETLDSVDNKGMITFGPSARKRICLRCYRGAAQDFGAESKSMFGKDKNGKMYARRRNGEIITHNAETFGAESKSMFSKDKNGKMYARRRNGEIITHNAETFEAPYGRMPAWRKGQRMWNENHLVWASDSKAVREAIKTAFPEQKFSVRIVNGQYIEVVAKGGTRPADIEQFMRDVKRVAMTALGEIYKDSPEELREKYVEVQAYERDWDAETFEAGNMMKPSRDWLSLALGTAAVVIGGSLFVQNRSMFKADGNEGEPSLVAHPSTGDLLPADYEEMIVESTGYAVPIIPISLDPAFMGSRFHALPTNRVVESNEPGIGAHTDVAMTRDTDFREPEQSMITRFNADGENCKCSLIEKLKSFITGKSCCEGKQVKEANSITGQTPYFGVGFDGKNTQTRVIKETNPVSLDPSTTSYIPQNLSGYTGQAYTPPTVYSDMMDIGVSGQNPAFVSTESSSLQSVHGNLSAGMNQSYTDGSRTMSLSQWSIDYDVSQTSDSEAFAVSRSSGVRTMIRRV